MLVEVVVEGVRALDREEARRRRRASPARREVRLEIGGRLQDREPPAGACAPVSCARRRQVQRPLREAAPGRVAASPRPCARSRMSSLRSSLRSMLRWRGVFVDAARTWRATLPSIRRGTSTWPRSPRSSRSRPHSSESAWRSATNSVAMELPGAVGGRVRRRAVRLVEAALGPGDEGGAHRSPRGEAPQPSAPSAGRREGDAPLHAVRQRVGVIRDGHRVFAIHELGAAGPLQHGAVLRDVGRVRGAFGCVGIDPRGALHRDDVATAGARVEVERDPRVRGDVRQAWRGRLRVHQHLARRSTGTTAGSSAAGRRPSRSSSSR